MVDLFGFERILILILIQRIGRELLWATGREASPGIELTLLTGMD
jgi:hypothetical protein